MKKTILLLVALISLSLFTAQAQKYGHVNSPELLKGMPGVDSIQIKLLAFQTELEGEYESMLNEFQAKKDKFDKDAGTMSSAIRQIREKELVDLQTRIQQFQYGVQDDLEQKQYDLIKPFQDKLQAAIDEVAKEHKYSYVFDVQTLLYYEGGEDITPLVKAKLGVK